MVPPNRLTAAPADPASPLSVLQRFRVIIRAAQQHSSWIEQQTGITGAQLWALCELAETPAMRVGDLAKKMALHQSTASNLLDRLEAQQLIARSRPDTDQRVVRVSLTEDGHKKLDAAPKPARGMLPDALRNLAGDDLAALQRALDQLLGKMQNNDQRAALKPLSFTD